MDCKTAIESCLCKADCCGCFQMDNEQLARFKGSFQKDGQHFPVSETETLIVTDDLRCVFLDRSDFHCVIHENRPNVCRKYGMIEELPCPIYDVNGIKRNRAGRRDINRKITKNHQSFRGWLKKQKAN